MSLGTMNEDSTFLDLSDRTEITFHSCMLHLNLHWKQLELHFDINIGEHAAGKYKIILPLKYVTPHTLVINRFCPETSQHSIFLETSVSPRVWKTSEAANEEDLRDRLYWSENEQWIRQCDIVQDPSDPSLELADTRIIMKHLIIPTGDFLVLQNLSNIH